MSQSIQRITKAQSFPTKKNCLIAVPRFSVKHCCGCGYESLLGIVLLTVSVVINDVIGKRCFSLINVECRAVISNFSGLCFLLFSFFFFYVGFCVVLCIRLMERA